MKPVSFLVLLMALLFIQCKQGDNPNAEPGSDEATQLVVGENDAVVLPAENTPESHETGATRTPLAQLISSNEGKYPRDIDLWNAAPTKHRLERLLGDKLQEVKEHFNVETPLVSHNGIYKTTGCQKNNCPAFHTTILIDTHKDNINVIVDKEGRSQVFAEGSYITMPEELKNR